MSMSPYYAKQRQQDELEARESAEQAAAAATASLEDKKKVQLYWWHTNGEPPTVTTVIAPIHPWFHPKDSEHLVARFQADRTFFQYFDWPSYHWVDQGPTSSRLNLSAMGARPLHYRSDGVNQAPGMPQSSHPSKRTHPDTPSSSALPYTPRVVLRRIESPLARGRSSHTPPSSSARSSSPLSETSSLHGRASSPALSATPSQGSSNWWESSQEDFTEWIEGGDRKVASEPCASSGERRAPSEPRTSSAATSHADDGPASSRIPALLPRAGSAPCVASALSAAPSQHTDLDLTPAPRGPSSAGWPWLYTCDMAAGFDAMMSLMSDGVRVQPAFETAFPGHKYKHSTVGDNFKAYKNALKARGAVEEAVGAGRTPAGEWAAFRKRWFKASK
ncbi:hypothetical protein C8Q76DRAFT_792640 [Earliella scabrosa]|nr:hypothetical protein C8Q76DRAFT_792640 [Earliella scabrosa]